MLFSFTLEEALRRNGVVGLDMLIALPSPLVVVDVDVDVDVRFGLFLPCFLG